MKLNIQAEINGQEILELFINQLKNKGLSPDPNNIKILVLNKQNQEIEVGVDKLTLKFEEKQV